MIIDDERDILRICELSLIKWGYDVEAFSDPLEALDRFKENQDEFSLVLSDIRMPGMDGIHLAKEMLKIKHNIKIIVMTAFEMDDFISTSLPFIKKDDVLWKPFKLIEVCAAVRKQLGVLT